MQITKSQFKNLIEEEIRHLLEVDPQWARPHPPIRPSVPGRPKPTPRNPDPGFILDIPKRPEGMPGPATHPAFPEWEGPEIDPGFSVDPWEGLGPDFDPDVPWDEQPGAPNDPLGYLTPEGRQGLLPPGRPSLAPEQSWTPDPQFQQTPLREHKYQIKLQKIIREELQKLLQS